MHAGEAPLFQLVLIPPTIIWAIGAAAVEYLESARRSSAAIHYEYSQAIHRFAVLAEL